MNYDSHMADLADHAAEQLQGTCQTLASLNLEGAEDNQTFCNRLDELVFCCEQCGWWCEQSQMAMRKDEDWICEDCTDDKDLIEND